MKTFKLAAGLSAALLTFSLMGAPAHGRQRSQLRTFRIGRGQGRQQIDGSQTRKRHVADRLVVNWCGDDRSRGDVIPALILEHRCH